MMQAKIGSFSLAISVACASCAPATSTRNDFGYKTVHEVPWPVAINEQLVAIHRVDYPIRKAAFPFCLSFRGGSGALVDSLSSYPENSRATVERATGLGPWPTVIAATPATPAYSAGLRRGDLIKAVGEIDFTKTDPGAVAGDRAIAAQEALDGNGTVKTVTVLVERDGSELSIRFDSEPVCGGYTTLKLSKEHNAFSDRSNVAITSGLVELVGSDDELAFVIGHELAHTVYGDSDKSEFSRRAKERRADLFATHAIRCTGFDPDAGSTLMARLENSDWQSWLRSPSHASYKKRAATMAALPTDLPCDDPGVLDLLTQKARS